MEISCPYLKGALGDKLWGKRTRDGLAALLGSVRRRHEDRLADGRLGLGDRRGIRGHRLGDGGLGNGLWEGFRNQYRFIVGRLNRRRIAKHVEARAARARRARRDGLIAGDRVRGGGVGGKGISAGGGICLGRKR